VQRFLTFRKKFQHEEFLLYIIRNTATFHSKMKRAQPLRRRIGRTSLVNDKTCNSNRYNFMDHV
jgi:hypothetical protein